MLKTVKKAFAWEGSSTKILADKNKTEVVFTGNGTINQETKKVDSLNMRIEVAGQNVGSVNINARNRNFVYQNEDASLEAMVFAAYKESITEIENEFVVTV